jgi:hypothetical protein
MAKNKWKVTMNHFGGKDMYSVVRLKDPTQPEHAGNREFAMDGYTEDRSEAESICKKLNEELDNG